MKHKKEEKEGDKKAESSDKSLSAYALPENNYKMMFTPDFHSDANNTISTLDKVASHYYVNPDSSLSVDILRDKQEEISKEAKE